MRLPEHVAAIRAKAIELGCSIVDIYHGGSGHWMVVVARGGAQRKISASSTPRGLCTKKAVSCAVRVISLLPQNSNVEPC